MARLHPRIALLLLLIPCMAQGDRADDRLHVIELFTSQGCSSCPAADRLVGQLIESEDHLLALEFHVDYWDDLVHGAAGRWKDPFSDPAHSARQRQYHRQRLAGRRGVYTPQVVIDGQYVTVGTDRGGIHAVLNSFNQFDVRVSTHRTSDSVLQIGLRGTQPDQATVWLIRFDRERVTEVRAGENRGRTLANHNIVRSMIAIGDWEGNPVRLTVHEPAPPAGQGCAILVQSRAQDAIRGAALC